MQTRIPTTTSSVLDQLDTQFDRVEVVADLDRLDEAVRHHTEQEEHHRDARIEAVRARGLLKQVLAYLDSTQSGEDEDEAGSEEPPGAPDDDGEEPEARRPRLTNKRGPILEIMRDHFQMHPEISQWWTVSEVREELEGRDITGSRNLIRLTLRRMVDAGQLQSNDEGDFALPEVEEGG
jgi:hypothetical protein